MQQVLPPAACRPEAALPSACNPMCPNRRRPHGRLASLPTPMPARVWPWLLLLLAALLLAALLLASPPARAQPQPQPQLQPQAADSPPPAVVAALPAPAASGSLSAGPPAGAALRLNQRHIVDFRAALRGRSPAERAAQAQLLLQQALDRGGPGRVAVWQQGSDLGLQVDGRLVFHLVAEDLALDQPGEPVPAAAEVVRNRLQAAVAEAHEARNPRRLAAGLGWSLLATALAWAAWHLVWWLRRRLHSQAAARLAAWGQAQGDQGLARSTAVHAMAAAQRGLTLLAVLLLLLVADLWFTFVLGQFAYTRPWAERSTQWLLGLLQQFALGVAGAVPGLLTAALVFVIARQLVRTLGNVLRRVERGSVVLPWLDRDTAGPTRRVGQFIIWLFALALAYPFLPGASSEAFKGVSVLVGLMLSMGASSVVGQVIAGMSLMYSRVLRSGEYVRIGDTEGTVAGVGMFATRLHTGMGEELSLPNAWVFGQPVRNFSRLVPDGQYVLHTAVTIGYATPWRQVHAMLLEAARRTPGVANAPAPFVVQTALSDFYVEYRLCVQGNHSAPQRRADAMSQLLANVQDVFNENAVQIMSPHYMADPPEAQVVRPEAWAPVLAPRAAASSAGAGAGGQRT